MKLNFQGRTEQPAIFLIVVLLLLFGFVLAEDSNIVPEQLEQGLPVIEVDLNDFVPSSQEIVYVDINQPIVQIPADSNVPVQTIPIDSNILTDSNSLADSNILIDSNNFSDSNAIAENIPVDLNVAVFEISLVSPLQGQKITGSGIVIVAIEPMAIVQKAWFEIDGLLETMLLPEENFLSDYNSLQLTNGMHSFTVHACTVEKCDTKTIQIDINNQLSSQTNQNQSNGTSCEVPVIPVAEPFLEPGTISEQETELPVVLDENVIDENVLTADENIVLIDSNVLVIDSNIVDFNAVDSNFVDENTIVSDDNAALEKQRKRLKEPKKFFPSFSIKSLRGEEKKFNLTLFDENRNIIGKNWRVKSIWPFDLVEEAEIFNGKYFVEIDLENDLIQKILLNNAIIDDNSVFFDLQMLPDLNAAKGKRIKNPFLFNPKKDFEKGEILLSPPAGTNALLKCKDWNFETNNCSSGWLRLKEFSQGETVSVPISSEDPVFGFEEITILNIQSHPQTGDLWEVFFTTTGKADLKIIPFDEATIIDDEFQSLSCGTEERIPQILENDVIFFPEWECAGEAKIVHYTIRAAKHILLFNFGDKNAFAFNDPGTIFLDTNAWKVDGWNVNNSMPVFSYSNDGNLTIDFNVATDTNFGYNYADLNYSTSKTQGTGTIIVNSLRVDGNRCQTNFLRTWNNLPNSDVNLMSYWKFNGQEDDYNSSRLFDYSGNNNHGVYLNGADNFSAGKWDTNAGYFDGINDHISATTNSNNLGISSELAISAWVKFPNGFDMTSEKDFVLLDSGAIKLFFDSTSGKLKLQAANKTQTTQNRSYDGSFDAIYSLAEYNGKLYAGTGDDFFEGTLMQYDGTSWTSVCSPGYEVVYALAVYKGNLYAGMGNGVNDGDIYKWDGSSCSLFYNGSQEAIHTLAVYDGNLFAGVGLGGGDGDVITFDGTNWSTSFDDGGDYQMVYSLAVYDGNLFAGTGYGASDSDILTFNGTTWSISYSGSQEYIYALGVYDGNLYAGQGYDTAGDGDVLTFDGTTWSTSYNGAMDVVISFVVFDGNLFAGTGYTTDTSASILTFNGTTWSKALADWTYAIGSMAVFDGNLFYGNGNINEYGDVWNYKSGFSVSSSKNSWISNQWYFVSATYDGTTAKLFIDNNADGTRTAPMTIDNAQNNIFSSKAFIGRATGTRQTGIDQSYFSANVEEMKVYNKALTASDVSLDYNLGVRNFRSCKWDWNISGVADANYYSNILLRDSSGNSDFNSSDKNFQVNPVPPQFLVKYGSFAKPSSTTGNQSITGVGFQPKIVIFFGNYLTADGNIASAQEYFGAASSSTQRAAMASASTDASAASTSDKRWSNALCITQITAGTPTLDAEADFVSMDSNGFTINWTTCDASQRIINYIALAGVDLNNAKVGSFTAPTTASDKSITDVGFKPDSLIIFDNSVSTTPASAGNAASSAFNIGFAVGTTKQNSRSTMRQDAQATSNTWGYQRTNSVQNSISGAGAVVRTAVVKSMDSNGFTLTFNPAYATAVYINYIALQGGQYDTGSFNEATSTGNQSVSTGFSPAGIIFQSAGYASSSSVSSTSRISFGVGVNSSERASIWSGDLDNQADSVSDSDLNRQRCIRFLTEGTPVLNGDMDFVSNDANGFTVNNTTVDGTAREILYFAFGSNQIIPIAVPDVNVSFPMAGESFDKYTLSTIDLNVAISDPDTNAFDMNIDLNYSTTNTQGSGTVIISDFNVARLTCDSNNLLTKQQCKYRWAISGIPTGTYYILAKAKDVNGNSDFNAGASTFTITSSAPNPNIDTNVWNVDGWNVNNSMPVFRYSADGNLTIDFNVASDTNFGYHYADLNYSTSKTQGTGTTIVNNLFVDSNRCQTNFLGTWNNTPNSDVNLVGYYKFDSQEEDYNNIRAFDYSGNNNHGQYYNGADNNAQGKWDNNAGFFDGVNDYIIGSSSLDLDAQNITIEAWVNFTDFSSGHENPRVIEVRDADYSIQIIRDTGSQRWVTKHSKWEAAITGKQYSIPAVATWYHVAAVFDVGSQSTKFYVNGVLDSNAANNNIGIGNKLNKYTIGVRSDFVATSYLKGKVEEVKIFKRSLSAEEISMDYNLSKRNFRSCKWDWNISAVADANYYANVLARDSIGNSDYNSSNNNFEVNAPEPAIPVIDANIWRVDGWNINNSMPVFRYLTDGNLTIDFNVASDTNFGYHFADLNYSTSKTQGTGTSIVNNLVVDSNRCQTNFIGLWNNSASSDVNLVGYYKFDSQEDVNSSRAFDYSGNNNHGQYLSGADNNAGGKWDNNSGFFDGLNDFIHLADSPFDFTGDFSISAWVKMTASTGVIQAIACKAESGGYCLEIDTSNRPDFKVHDGTAYRTGGGNTGISTNEWVHVVGVVNGTEVSLYQNGIKQATTGSLIAAVSTTNYPLSIGANPGASNIQFMNGYIDEVKIYGRALTAAEISSDYNFGKRNFRKCSWDWNISGVADSNYYANILVRDSSGNNDFNSSNNNFEVNAPIVNDFSFLLSYPLSGCSQGKGSYGADATCDRGYFETTDLVGTADENKVNPEGQTLTVPFFVYDNQSTASNDMNFTLDLNASLPASLKLKVAKNYSGWALNCSGNTDIDCLQITTTGQNIGKAAYSSGTYDLNIFLWADFNAAAVGQTDRNVTSESVSST